MVRTVNFDMLQPVGQVILIYAILIALVATRNNRSFDDEFKEAVSQSQTTCLSFVLAHPDDESMFMTPFLGYLGEVFRELPDFKLHMLTITNGNAEGKGNQREEELSQICSKYRIDCKVLADDRLTDGPHQWDEEVVKEHVQEYIKGTGCRFIVTFDEDGVSSHPNHISTHQAVKAVKAGSPDLVVWQLVTYAIVPKYMPFLGVVNALSRGRTICKFSPIEVLRNMSIHRSQLRWHVYLWSFFSTYAYANTFVDMEG